MQFHPKGTAGMAGLQLLGICIHKQTHRDASPLEPTNALLQLAQNENELIQRQNLGLQYVMTNRMHAQQVVHELGGLGAVGHGCDLPFAASGRDALVADVTNPAPPRPLCGHPSF